MVYKTDVVRTEPEIVDVDMTKYHYAMIALGVTTTGLTATTGYLWHRLRKNEQYIDALKEYISRLVQTDCGREAYETFLEDVEDETDEHLYENHLEEDGVADFSEDEPIPYEVEREAPILRRARDIKPNV